MLTKPYDYSLKEVSNDYDFVGANIVIGTDSDGSAIGVGENNTITTPALSHDQNTIQLTINYVTKERPINYIYLDISTKEQVSVVPSDESKLKPSYPGKVGKAHEVKAPILTGWNFEKTMVNDKEVNDSFIVNLDRNDVIVFYSKQTEPVKVQFVYEEEVNGKMEKYAIADKTFPGQIGHPYSYSLADIYVGDEGSSNYNEHFLGYQFNRAEIEVPTIINDNGIEVPVGEVNDSVVTLFSVSYVEAIATGKEEEAIAAGKEEAAVAAGKEEAAVAAAKEEAAVAAAKEEAAIAAGKEEAAVVASKEEAAAAAEEAAISAAIEEAAVVNETEQRQQTFKQGAVTEFVNLEPQQTSGDSEIITINDPLISLGSQMTEGEVHAINTINIIYDKLYNNVTELKVLDNEDGTYSLIGEIKNTRTLVGSEYTYKAPNIKGKEFVIAYKNVSDFALEETTKIVSFTEGTVLEGALDTIRVPRGDLKYISVYRNIYTGVTVKSIYIDEGIELEVKTITAAEKKYLESDTYIATASTFDGYKLVDDELEIKEIKELSKDPTKNIIEFYYTTEPMETTPPPTEPTETTPPPTEPTNTVPPTTGTPATETQTTETQTTETPATGIQTAEVSVETTLAEQPIPEGNVSVRPTTFEKTIDDTNYSLIHNTENDMYMVLDEDGVPLGFVRTPEEFIQLDDMTPLGSIKINPVTGDVSSNYPVIVLFISVLLLGVLLLSRKPRKECE